MSDVLYQALLFTPDGEYVTDYHNCQSVDEVWEKIDNQGSRWFFYPIPFVVRDHPHQYSLSVGQRIIDAPEMFEHLKGKPWRIAQRYIQENGAEIVKELNAE